MKYICTLSVVATPDFYLPLTVMNVKTFTDPPPYPNRLLARSPVGNYGLPIYNAKTTYVLMYPYISMYIRNIRNISPRARHRVLPQKIFASSHLKSKIKNSSSRLISSEYPPTQCRLQTLSQAPGRRRRRNQKRNLMVSNSGKKHSFAAN